MTSHFFIVGTLVIVHILQNRPNGQLVESVWDYGGRYNPFRSNVFERELFIISGQKYSLNDMEKGILLNTPENFPGQKVSAASRAAAAT